MALDYNHVGLCGRLTRDAELAYSSSGVAYSKFSIAVNGWKENDVAFVNCVMFGKSAEAVSKWLTRGKQVIVNGSWSQSRYEKDGQKQTRDSVNVNQVQLLSGGADKPSLPQQQFDDEQIPF